MVDGRAEFCVESCFLCGHCRAVCPVDCVQIPGMADTLGLAALPEIPEVIPPGAGNTSELIALMRSRRSCRQYQETTIELDLLQDLVKIGTTAPSGTNSQSWNFIILPSRPDVTGFGEMIGNYYRKLNRMAGNPLLRLVVKIFGGDSLGRYYRNYYHSVQRALNLWDEGRQDLLFHGATAAILVSGRPSASCPVEDSMLATQNILLAAHSAGLGSCLIGFAVEAMRRSPSIRKKLKCDAGEDIHAVIALGYPAVTYLRPACRREVAPRILRLRTMS
jgi:nitroreductase